MGWIRVGVLAAFMLAGCVEQASLDCGDGMFECPSGTTCDVGRHRCLRDGELAACEGKAEGDACTFMDVSGACFDGLCESSTCGDGKIGPGEICDDGNLKSGDGCRGDCRSDETCGNGLIDHEAGEDCDCGDPSIGTPGLGCADFNSLTSDVATCRPVDCTYRCGDSVVEPGELCDTVLQEGQDCLEFGYDTGELSCSAVCAPAFAGCVQFGWPPVSTGVPDAHLRSIWGLDANNIFAVGDLGVILHYDGTTWSRMTTPPALPHLSAVWGRSATEVYAVGDNASVLRYDGNTWSPMITGYENQNPQIFFKGISGNATNMYVVGGSFPGSDLKGIVLQYANNTWTPRIVPGGSLSAPTAAPMMLTVVVDTARSEVTVAGEGSVGGETGKIYRAAIGSSTWTDKSTTGTANTNRFVGSALLGGEVYLVGLEGLYKSPAGGDFARVGSFGNLSAIWGTSATSYFVLGDRASYYDGVRWLTASEGFVPNAGLWGTSTGNVWAVGNGVRHFEGTSWSALPPAPTSAQLLALGTGSAGAWAGDYDGALMRFSTDSQSGVGQWSLASTTGINCPSTKKSPIVGISLGTDIVVALSRDGQMAYALSSNYDSYQCDDNVPPTALYGVYAVDKTHVVTAVGGGGGIYQRVPGGGAGWTTMTVDWGASPPTPKPIIRSIFGFGLSNMFAVGDNGVIARWTGGSAWTVSSPVVSALNDVWGTSDQDMYAVGGNGTIMHFNGTSWTPMTSGTINTLEAVWGRSATDVYAAGGDTLLHYDGTKWLPVRDPSLQAIHDLGGAANWLFGVGDSGTIEMLMHL